MPPSDRYHQLYIVTWDQLHRDCRELAWKLTHFMPFTGIIAVTRGGLLPASILSRELDIRCIDTVSVVSYDWQNQGEARCVKPLATPTDGEGWLVVDDLVDTGKTLAYLRETLPKAHFATIYAKPKGKPLVDTFVTEVSQDTWILQPWDSETQFVEPIVKRRNGSSDQLP